MLGTHRETLSVCENRLRPPHPSKVRSLSVVMLLDLCISGTFPWGPSPSVVKTAEALAVSSEFPIQNLSVPGSSGF